MSSRRVIKGVVWQENSYRIEVPHAEVEEEYDDELSEDDDAEVEFEEEKKPSIDEETINRMMAEVAAREQQAADKIKDAEKQAAALLQAAKEEAAQIRDEANAEVDKLRADAAAETEKLRIDTQQACEKLKIDTEKVAKDEGYKKGHAEGQEKGYKDGLQKAKDEMKAQLDESVKKAEHVLNTAKEATKDYLVKAEQDFAEIIIRVVEKVIPQHFIDAPQVILPAVRQALMKVRDQKEIIIHVAPDCYDFVLMARDEFRALLTGGNAALEVQSDDSLKAGDCLLETPNGSVDARLQTQLEILKQAVKGVLSKYVKA